MAVERQTVWQVGQLIVMRQVVKAFRLSLGFADIGEGGDKMRNQPGIIVNCRNAHLLRIDRAILAPIPDFAFPVTVLGDEIPDIAMEVQAMMLLAELGRRQSEHLASPVSGGLLESRIDRQYPLRGVGQDHRLGGVVDHPSLQGKLAICLLTHAE